MSFKGPGEMAIIISTINALVYIDILDKFLITLIENWFGDDEVIFQNETKRMRAFLQEKQKKSIVSEQSGSKSG